MLALFLRSGTRTASLTLRPGVGGKLCVHFASSSMDRRHGCSMPATGILTPHEGAAALVWALTWVLVIVVIAVFVITSVLPTGLRW